MTTMVGAWTVRGFSMFSVVEKSTGRKIPTRMVTMERFRTVDAICESFGSDSEAHQ